VWTKKKKKIEKIIEKRRFSSYLYFLYEKMSLLKF
jgi:hypothetical protein